MNPLFKLSVPLYALWYAMTLEMTALGCPFTIGWTRKKKKAPLVGMSDMIDRLFGLA